MKLEEVIPKIDHTCLNPHATWADIKTLCDEAEEYGAASVCIPPSYVRHAAQYLNGRVKICTVIGFPNGYSTTASKVFETADAVKCGADEIDTVINIGDLKDKNYDAILAELKQIKAVCGDKILKVIIETCLLTDEEKIKMCEIVSESGADFIKTSTGFSTAGAQREDITLFKKHIAPHVKIKAAGGIRTLKDAEDFIALGAHRIGASAVIKSLKGE